jgi:asparagine synthetase B (glutamine-hydrolysing)
VRCERHRCYHLAASAPEEVELLATRDAMRARGPDGSGLWWSLSRRCGLGHRRLSILDLSDRASQPVVSADGKLVITFNGEIYNYKALRAELEGEGARFRTTSDTEVLLHLYARYGGRWCNDCAACSRLRFGTKYGVSSSSPGILTVSSRFTLRMTVGSSALRRK